MTKNIKFQGIIILVALGFYVNVSAQKKTREQYVSEYYKMAIEEMNRYRIPASITLAQGILETESGNSDLCRIAKNHFGIKCKTTWQGMKFIKDDDTKNECFRAYSSAEESFRDHSLFLVNGDRYANLFTFDIKDYKSWAYGLKEAGYATAKTYPQMLLKHIEDLKLYQFDNYGSMKSMSNIKIEDEQNQDSSSNISAEERKKLIQNELSSLAKSRANNLNYVTLDRNLTLMDISKINNIPFLNLILFNELDGEQLLMPGQNIFLQKKLSSNPVGKHIVKAGESIYDISQIYGMTSESIRRFNRLEKYEQVSSGDTLYLDKMRETYPRTRTYYEIQNEKIKLGSLNSSSTPKVYNGVSSNATQPVVNTIQPIPGTDKYMIMHTIKAQENVFRISKLYDVSVNDILVWNNLTVESGLTVGQVLKIISNKKP